MSSIKCSVIVPVYNTAPYLRKCLDSLFAQTLDSLELIFVDDGSRDDSVRILNEYRERHANMIVLSGENAGTVAARCKGLRMASGEYVGFVDSDDWIEPDMFNELYQGAVLSGADIVACNIAMVNDKGDSWGSCAPRKETLDFIGAGREVNRLRFLNLDFGGVLSNKLYKRSLFDIDALWQLAGGLPNLEDVLMNYFLCSRAGKAFVNLGKPLYNYYQRSGSAANAPAWHANPLPVVYSVIERYFKCMQGSGSETMGVALCFNEFEGALGRMIQADNSLSVMATETREFCRKEIVRDCLGRVFGTSFLSVLVQSGTMRGRTVPARRVVAFLHYYGFHRLAMFPKFIKNRFKKNRRV